MRSLLMIGWICLLSASDMQAQQLSLYPDVITSYDNHLPTINPGYVYAKGKGIANATYRFRPDVPKVSSFLLDGAWIKSLKGGNHHSFGFNIFNESEGPYISTPRLYLQYAYQIKIQDELFLSFGASAGIVNRVYTAPSATGDGNVFLPDAGIGISLASKRLIVGCALKQLLNSEAVPVQAVLRLKTYFSAHASYRFKISDNVSLVPHGLLRLLPEVGAQGIVGAKVHYMNSLIMGMSYYTLRGIGVSMGVNLPSLPFSFSIAYNSALFSNSPLWVNSFELGLHYVLK